MSYYAIKLVVIDVSCPKTIVGILSNFSPVDYLLSEIPFPRTKNVASNDIGYFTNVYKFLIQTAREMTIPQAQPK